MTLQVTYQMPRDQDAFQRAHFAGDAWYGIIEAMNTIRNHRNHGKLTADQVIDKVSDVLSAAQRKIEG